MTGKNKKIGFVVPILLVALVLINGPLSSLGASIHAAHPVGPLSPAQHVSSGDNALLAVVGVLAVVAVFFVAVALAGSGDHRVQESKSRQYNKAAIAHAEFDR